MSVQLNEALMYVQLIEAHMSVQLTAALMSAQLIKFMSVQLTEAIEALDPDHQCGEYWHGKADREAAAAGLPPVERGSRPPRPSGGAAPRLKRTKKTRCVHACHDQYWMDVRHIPYLPGKLNQYPTCRVEHLGSIQ